MKKIELNISREKNKDTGLVILLVMAWWFFCSGDIRAVQISVVCILVTLVSPSVLTPVTFIIQTFSNVMGTVISKVLLTVVFFGIVTPVGIIRRIVTRGQLKTELWKKSRESVFNDRNKRFTASDMEHPF